MSSSRSIAAARNRRAGEQQPVQTRSGPGTSIASQAAFVQQMQQGQGRGQMPQGRQMSQGQQMQQMQQNQQPQVSSLANGVPSNVKLSISDAIGLITLRLGKVEQFIIELENQILPSLRGNSGSSGNTQPIDISVINSVVNRLDSLEKMQRELQSSGSSNLNKDKVDTSKFEKEIRDIKDALMLQMVKYDKFSELTDKKINDIHQRLTDIDNAFVEFENQMHVQSLNEGCLNDLNLVTNENDTIIGEGCENEDSEEISSNLASDNLISSVDLKSLIKEQLSEI